MHCLLDVPGCLQGNKACGPVCASEYEELRQPILPENQVLELQPHVGPMMIAAVHCVCNIDIYTQRQQAQQKQQGRYHRSSTVICGGGGGGVREEMEWNEFQLQTSVKGMQWQLFRIFKLYDTKYSMDDL